MSLYGAVATVRTWRNATQAGQDNNAAVPVLCSRYQRHVMIASSYEDGLKAAQLNV